MPANVTPLAGGQPRAATSAAPAAGASPKHWFAAMDLFAHEAGAPKTAGGEAAGPEVVVHIAVPPSDMNPAEHHDAGARAKPHRTDKPDDAAAKTGKRDGAAPQTGAHAARASHTADAGAVVNLIFSSGQIVHAQPAAARTQAAAHGEHAVVKAEGHRPDMTANEAAPAAAAGAPAPAAAPETAPASAPGLSNPTAEKMSPGAVVHADAPPAPAAPAHAPPIAATNAAPNAAPVMTAPSARDHVAPTAATTANTSSSATAAAAGGHATAPDAMPRAPHPAPAPASVPPALPPAAGPTTASALAAGVAPVAPMAPAQAPAAATPAAALAAAPAAAPVPATPSALAAAVVAMQKAGDHAAILNLDPAGLGAMTVHVSMGHNAQVNVQFVPALSQTAHLLDRHLDDLRQAMTEAGIALGHTSVSPDGGNTGRGGAAFGQAPRQAVPARLTPPAPAAAADTRLGGLSAYA